MEGGKRREGGREKGWTEGGKGMEGGRDKGVTDGGWNHPRRVGWSSCSHFCFLVLPPFCALVVPSFHVLVVLLSRVVVVLLSHVLGTCGRLLVFVLGCSCCLGGRLCWQWMSCRGWSGDGSGCGGIRQQRMTKVIVRCLVATSPSGDVAPSSGVDGCSRVDAVDVISPWVSFQKRWGKEGDLAGCKDYE